MLSAFKRHVCCYLKAIEWRLILVTPTLFPKPQNVLTYDIVKSRKLEIYVLSFQTALKFSNYFFHLKVFT